MLFARIHDISHVIICWEEMNMLGFPDMGCCSFIKIKMRMWKELKRI